MKILYFIDCLSSGGKERRFVELLKGLVKRNDLRIELAVMSQDVHYDDIFKLNIKIHYIIRNSNRDLSVFVRLFRICREFSPDILHCWDSMTAVYSSPVCKLLNIKLVNGMVNDCPDNRSIFRKPLFRARLTFPFADLVIANSKAGLAAYKAPEKKSIVINNGFDFSRTNNVISPHMLRESLEINTRFIVGMVATFSDFKDYPTFFKGAHLILKNRNDVTFLAIGKDTDSDLSKGIIDPEYSRYFRLLGKKSNVESYVNSFDIGVLTTFTEGISNSIIEYMASGKPVIATVGGGTGELIKDRETGFLISQANPEELAEKICTLLNNDKLRQEMGESGKLRIKNEYSMETMIRNFYDSYRNIAS